MTCVETLLVYFSHTVLVPFKKIIIATKVCVLLVVGSALNTQQEQCRKQNRK